MAIFERSFNHIILVEGPYTNNKHDKGTHTKYGITMRSYSDFLGREVYPEEIRDLTTEKARDFYYKCYWRPLQLDQFPDRIGLAFFDQAVNRGAYRATLILQRILGVTVDGIMGTQTVGAVKAKKDRALTWHFLRECLEGYMRIVQRDPSQLSFIAGWANRISHLIDVTLIDQAR